MKTSILALVVALPLVAVDAFADPRLSRDDDIAAMISHVVTIAF